VPLSGSQSSWVALSFSQYPTGPVGSRPLFGRIEIRPDVGASGAAGLANELRLNIRAVDQNAADAQLSHFVEGDFLGTALYALSSDQVCSPHSHLNMRTVRPLWGSSMVRTIAGFLSQELHTLIGLGS
jgi:hypothetical protein